MNFLLLLPDGVGVRNFLYTDFLEKVLVRENQVTIWAEESILGLVIGDERIQKQTLPTQKPTTPAIETLRKAWQTALLRWQAHKFKDPIYIGYIFPHRISSFKSVVKWIWERWLLFGNISEKGVQKLRQAYLLKSTHTAYFDACIAQLESIRPDIILCTHQRSSSAIAPLLAAKKLGIPTACFIFSWDNLPKATLFVEADHYLVWSQHMKQEMETYHPEVAPNRVHIVGTPQFQPYFDESLRQSREEFCAQHQIDPTKRFICFTGDDIKTSPHDPIYLQHIAETLREMNKTNGNLYHIIFRRCPVDWSSRFDEVLRSHKDIIHSIDPLWASEKAKGGWNHFVPTHADIALLVNNVLHSDLTINIGSTTALDFATLGKPACYIRYNAVGKSHWDVHKVYCLVHFRSMDGLEPVYWINSRETMAHALTEALEDTQNRVMQAQTWHQRIAQHPLEAANERIGQVLEKISIKLPCTSVS